MISSFMRKFAGEGTRLKTRFKITGEGTFYSSEGVKINSD